jgi:hypothetical protein
MFDRDRTGTINVYEFGDLFNYINQWKALFESIDRDRSGFIEFAELQQGKPTDDRSHPHMSLLQTSLTRTHRAPLISMSSSSCSTTLTSGRVSSNPLTAIGPERLNRAS